MPKKAKRSLAAKKTTSKRKNSLRKKKQPLLLQTFKDKRVAALSLAVFAVIGAIFVFNSFASGPQKFIRKVDVGPQASTYGHTPYGKLKKWTGSTTIAEGSAPRDSDGWMRLKGYEFKGPLFIKTSKVALEDCKVTYDTSVNNATHGTVVIKDAKAAPYYIDHCIIDQSDSGWSNAGVDAYYAGTVRYSLIVGSGDAIKSGRDSLFEHNYLEVNGQGTENAPGHIDGIQGEYFKFNWIARHNTIIGGVGQAPSGGTYRPEHGGNIGIYAPTTANGSAGPSGAEGVVAEDNYIDGFNTGISIQSTNSNNPAMIRNNEIGPNLRYYPGLAIRIFSTSPTMGEKADYIIVKNNRGDRIFNDNTGTTSAYDGKVGTIDDFIGATYDGGPVPPSTPGHDAPEPGTPSTPDPTDPDPNDPDDSNPPATPPSVSTDLPVSYDFSTNTNGWSGQGNTLLAHDQSQGNTDPGALKLTVDQAGPYPDNSRTARAGTTQWSNGLKTTAGTKVSARVAIKSASTRQARCELRFYRNHSILATVPGTMSATSSHWTNRTCSATAPSGTTNVALRVFIDDASYGEVFLLDDAQVVEGELAITPPVVVDPDTTNPQPDDPEPQPSSDTQAPSAPKQLQRSLGFSWTKFAYVLNLNWQPATDNTAVTYYTIWRNGQALGKVNKTSFSDSNMSAGTAYTYKVKAHDAAGNVSTAATVKAKGSCFLFWCHLE